MRKLSSLITGVAAVTLSVGLLGCPTVDPGDPFESLTTVSNDDTTGDGDGDGDQTGDGDGDQTGDGDGDQTGDGDGDGECGSLGAACSGDTCCAGLSCQANGSCGIGGGDGDGDGDPGDDPWNPASCTPPSQVLMVGDLAGNFCSAPCMGAMDMSCPPGPAGTQAACALTTMAGADPSFCALVCQPANDGCPAGSSCKDLMDPMNPGLGLCTYP
jgi:hypothetical protein